jgi:sortase B
MIYGHNMWDGSMFSDLVMYTSQDFFDEHSVVYLGTPKRNYELRALATAKISGNAPVRVFDFADAADFSGYLDTLLTEPLAEAADLRSAQPNIANVYSLITCNTDNNAYRIVLICTPVRSVEQTGPPAEASQ